MGSDVKTDKKTFVGVRMDDEMARYIDEHPLRKAEGQSGVVRHLLRLGVAIEKEASR
jgi:negative regulator of replication initiation